MREIRDVQHHVYQPASASGKTPATTPGTAASNNLAAVMKNTVVLFKPSRVIVNPPVSNPAKPSGR